MNKDIYVFTVQDNICGGLIIANSEEEAREKLSKQRGINMDAGTTFIYKLNKDIFDEYDVVDLW